MADRSYNFDEMFLPVDRVPDLHVAKEIVKLWKKANNGRYYVFRGAINWALFEFDKYPLAVAIMVQDQGFLQDINAAEVVFEAYAKVPLKTKDGVDGMDDRVQAAIKRDIRGVLTELAAAKMPGTTDSLVHKFYVGSDSMVDTSDMTLGVQGVVASVTIDY